MTYKYLVVVDGETDEAVFEREYTEYPAELIRELRRIYPPPRYSIERAFCDHPLKEPHRATRGILADLPWLERGD